MPVANPPPAWELNRTAPTAKQTDADAFFAGDVCMMVFLLNFAARNKKSFRLSVFGTKRRKDENLPRYHSFSRHACTLGYGFFAIPTLCNGSTRIGLLRFSLSAQRPVQLGLPHCLAPPGSSLKCLFASLLFRISAFRCTHGTPEIGKSQSDDLLIILH